MGCLFCDIAGGRHDAHLIYEDDSHIAILDKYPIQPGHSLVIPREHHEKIIDVPEEGVSSLFTKVPMLARAILKATGADGFNIGQNNGKAANQIIPHVHVHIIPRYEKLSNPWKRRMIATDEELRELAGRIRKFVSSA
ncbi:MAG: HIT family protein [Thaumarchaeota archaeon]|nr:HIT family protein [Nitrososphaerota archaeon]